jgi:hypothetical protein
MGESSTLQIDLLKPHVRALLDEVRRAGPAAARTALYEADLELIEKQRPAVAGANLEGASVAMSCAGLYTLSAVAYQLYVDTQDVQYLLDAADYYLAAKAQGCNSHD